MRQQINLYQPIFRSPRKIFCARALLQILVIALTGLGLAYGYSQWRMQALAQQVAQLSTTRDRTQGRLDELRREYPVRSASPLLQQELIRLAAELGRAQALATALNDGAFGNTSGLSAYLLGFARQHVDGTWLTHIDIANGGSVIGLSGAARRPALIPELVQRLTQESAFAGKSFSSLQLKQDASAPGTVEFSIKTDAAIKKDSDHG